MVAYWANSCAIGLREVKLGTLFHHMRIVDSEMLKSKTQSWKRRTKYFTIPTEYMEHHIADFWKNSCLANELVIYLLHNRLSEYVVEIPSNWLYYQRHLYQARKFTSRWPSAYTFVMTLLKLLSKKQTNLRCYETDLKFVSWGHKSVVSWREYK